MKELSTSLLLLIFLCISVKLLGQHSQGFFLDNNKPKTAIIPPYTDEQTLADSPTLTVTINTTDTIATVSKYVYGNNANVYMSQMVDQPALIQHVTTLSPNIIRFPGGNLSSIFFWDAPANQPPADSPDTLVDAEGRKFKNGYWFGKNTENWTMSLDNYYKMLELTGSTGIITINYSYARYGTGPTPVQTAAHYAAQWVRYDKGKTKYWEIGNENSGSWQAGYRIDTKKNKDGQPEFISGELYGQHFNIFADSMRAAAAETGTTIYIGAQVIQTQPESWDTQINKTWNAGLFKSAGNAADFFIVHSYYTPYNQNSTPEQILNTPAAETKAMKEYVSKCVQEAGVEMKPLALTEWNIFAEGSKQYVSYINGIHAAMTLGELIKNKYGMASRWDLANGWNSGNDHGMFSQGDEPGNVPRWNPRPVYYYMYYFQKYFGDHMVNSYVSGSTEITSYASIFRSGQAGIVVVNKSSSAKTVALDLQNFGYGNRYYVYSLTGGTDNGRFSLKTFVNGIGPTLQAGGPPDIESIKAKAYSTQNGVVLNFPAYSVHYVLVEHGERIPTALPEELQQAVKVYPNPSAGSFKINLNFQDYFQLEVLDMKGQVLLSREIKASTQLMEIHIDTLPGKGTYLLKLYSHKGVVVKKLVIH